MHKRAPPRSTRTPRRWAPSRCSHRLHLGHHRDPQGCGADAREPHVVGLQRRARHGARRRRRAVSVSSAGAHPGSQTIWVRLRGGFVTTFSRGTPRSRRTSGPCAPPSWPASRASSRSSTLASRPASARLGLKQPLADWAVRSGRPTRPRSAAGTGGRLRPLAGRQAGPLQAARAPGLDRCRFLDLGRRAARPPTSPSSSTPPGS